MFYFKFNSDIPKTKIVVAGSAQFIGVVKSGNPSGTEYGLIVVGINSETVKDIAAIDTEVADVFCKLRDFIAANALQGFSHEGLVAVATNLGAIAEFGDTASSSTS